MPESQRLLIETIKDVTVVTFQDISILDALQIDEIGEELYELVEKKDCRQLILDFTNVKFLSSSALSVLITLHKKAAQNKGQVVLCDLRDDLKKVFEITRLDRMFTFCPTLDDALAVFGRTTAG
ncbi:MAG TPA: STAS domain-containing protein [Phycisphaerae bacterium]|nr:STAS domain-containing protein [Phycisphaerae bacterium]HRR86346.1 STAS domain-containing protein [Phycisphaerae bacterium]